MEGFINLFIKYYIFSRRSSSGEHFSVMSESLSPSPGALGMTSKGSSISNTDVTSTNGSVTGSQHSGGGSTSYHSSTLPHLRKRRGKVATDKKTKKVRLYIQFTVEFLSLISKSLLCWLTETTMWIK